jgi:hypothetical protein
MSGSIANRLDRLERTQGHHRAPCGCEVAVAVIEEDDPEPASPLVCRHGNRCPEEFVVRIIHQEMPLPGESTGHA